VKPDHSIPIARPDFTADEIDAISEVLRSGWVVQGPNVVEFERAFADFVQAEHAVAMTSCTTALHASVVAMGIGPGDEVVVPAFTWVATANVVEQTGAKPVFCDIEPGTYNIDVRRLGDLVTERTVGIIPVHLFGLAADLPAVIDVAQRKGLWVIEDAACGLGAAVDERHVGTAGTIGCFSFHPRKSITTGEGGMAVTNDDSLAEILRSLRDHGSAPSLASTPGMAAYPRLGFNYRMTDIQGAIGRAQLRRAHAFIDERRRIAAAYDERLADVPWVHLPLTPSGYAHGYQAYVIRVPLEVRDRLMAHLTTCDIASRPGTHAPPLTDYYRSRYGYRNGDFPEASEAERSTLALPMFPGLTSGEIRRVVDAVASFPVAGHTP
jgi:dTDP-4-amino-4,6-dideoxygalactose transaminase